MRVLHTSDWHVGRAIRGRSRADEHRAVLSEIVRIGQQWEVDLVLVAGDVFDSAAPSPESERIVYRTLLDLADVAPVVIVAGNHDNPRRLRAVTPLLKLGRVTSLGFVTRPEDGGVVVGSDIGLGCPTRVALLPWQNQRGIVTAADLMSKQADQTTSDYAGRMGLIINALCQSMTLDSVNLLVSHLTVHGARDVGSERAAHVFGYAVAAQTFPGHLSYVALGHFHRQQQIPASAPVWYAGSPLQLDFGEAGEDKGVLVIEAEPGLPAAVNPVRLVSGKRLVVLRGTLDEVVTAAGDHLGSYIKVEIDEPARAGMADEVRARIPGVVDVTLSVVHRQSAASDVPKRVGRSPRDLFREYLSECGIEDKRVSELFDQLVDESSDET